jgi:4-oxalocrotonate tautomerase
MSFVTIKLIGQSPDTRRRIAEGTVRVITEATGLPENAVWVVFEDIKADDWYVGPTSVGVARRKADGMEGST